MPLLFSFAFDKTSKHLEKLNDCQILKNRGTRRDGSHYHVLFIGGWPEYIELQ